MNTNPEPEPDAIDNDWTPADQDYIEWLNSLDTDTNQTEMGSFEWDDFTESSY